MRLLDIIFFMLCGAWLVGFAWDLFVAYKGRKKE